MERKRRISVKETRLLDKKKKLSEKKEKLVVIAKLAEQAGRYDEMAYIMKKVVLLKKNLSAEERNMISLAYMNVVGSKRAALRIVLSLERKEAKKGEGKMTLIQSYRKDIQMELVEACKEVIDVVDNHLIKDIDKSEPDADEAEVFYKKMKGDYHRYQAEFSTGNERKTAAETSLIAYKHANDIAGNRLNPTHPIRLGLALNFSVFYYEILQTPERACRLAKNAFDEAIAELDTLSEDSYKDSTLIMQLLRDNLTLWTSDIEDDGGKGDTGIQDMEDQDAS